MNEGPANLGPLVAIGECRSEFPPVESVGGDRLQAQESLVFCSERLVVLIGGTWIPWGAIGLIWGFAPECLGFWIATPRKCWVGCPHGLSEPFIEP